MLIITGTLFRTSVAVTLLVGHKRLFHFVARRLERGETRSASANAFVASLLVSSDVVKGHTGGFTWLTVPRTATSTPQTLDTITAVA